MRCIVELERGRDVYIDKGVYKREREIDKSRQRGRMIAIEREN